MFISYIVRVDDNFTVARYALFIIEAGDKVVKTKQENKVYILRCWQESKEGEQWRFRLENTHSQETYGFQEWESLVAFLQADLPITNSNDNSMP